MSTSGAGAPPEGLGRAVARRIVQVLLTYTLWFLTFFAAAGTLQSLRVWIYAGLTLLLLALNFAWVLPRNPTVIVERGKTHEGTKGFDKVFLWVFGIGMLGLPALAGLDVGRFGWSELPMGWACP